MHALKIPIPFPVKYTNCYLIPESKLLIDPGPNTPQSYRSLLSQLGKLRFELRDLDGIILTHGHLDHSGMCSKLSQISEVPVYVHPLDSWMISEPERYSELMKQTAAYLISEGFSSKIAQALSSQASIHYFRSLMDPVPDLKHIPNLWDDLEIIHTPGHSPGHVCLYNPTTGELISGDHLLHGITPITFPSYGRFGTGLRSYLESLEKLWDMDISVVFPGHGQAFSEMRSRILQIKHRHRNRIQSIIEILRESPRNACDISKLIFGNLPGDQVVLAAYEILSHLEFLLDEGKIQAFEFDGKRYYRLVE